MVNYTSREAIIRSNGQLAMNLGLLDDVSPLFVWGRKLTVAIAPGETLWAPGGLYVYAAAATVNRVSSSSALDSLASSGASHVLIEGLDANFNPVTDTIALDGTNNVDGTVAMLRRNKATIVNGVNAGDISIIEGPGGGAALQEYIPAGEGLSSKLVYTVAADRVAFIAGTFSNSGTARNVSIQLRFSSPGAFGRRTLHVRNAIDQLDTTFAVDGHVWRKVESRTDVEVRGIQGVGAAATADGAVGMGIIEFTG